MKAAGQDSEERGRAAKRRSKFSGSRFPGPGDSSRNGLSLGRSAAGGVWRRIWTHRWSLALAVAGSTPGGGAAGAASEFFRLLGFGWPVDSPGEGLKKGL